jgi:hypothetical protein
MSASQKIVAGITAVSLAAVLLFPPFDQFSIGSLRVPAFSGFYLFLAPPPYGAVNTSLLLLEAFVVLINGGIAWLLVRDRASDAGAKPARSIGYQNAVLMFAGVNLVVIVLFPPLESVFALTNAALPSFEGFYFIFDQHPNHTIVTTLLYLEVIFVLVNAALAWLIFRHRRPAVLSPEELRALAGELRARKN